MIVFGATLLLSGCNIQNPFQTEKKPENQVGIPDVNKEERETESNQNETDKAHELALEAAYFNEVKEVNGEIEILNPDNLLALVNKTVALPGTYTPADLVRPKVKFTFGDADVEKSYLRKDAAEALEKMFAAAKKDSIQLFAVSGYRSYIRQEVILNSEIKRVGEEKAAQAVAYPGKSEHQTGLAMDITGESVKFLLTEEFEGVPEGKWLKKHAHEHGYILRYPKGKETLTGYMYEPWHFRYVGKKAAGIIYKNDWTLEEFFEQVIKI